MILNTDKFHLTCLGKDTKNETFMFNNFMFNNSNEEKILGISIDNKLKVTLKFYIEKPPRK